MDLTASNTTAESGPFCPIPVITHYFSRTQYLLVNRKYEVIGIKATTGAMELRGKFSLVLG